MYFQNSEKDEKLTTVQKFYYGTNIFITGATGFLGKSKYNEHWNAIKTKYVQNSINYKTKTKSEKKFIFSL